MYFLPDEEAFLFDFRDLVLEIRQLLVEILQRAVTDFRGLRNITLCLCGFKQDFLLLDRFFRLL